MNKGYVNMKDIFKKIGIWVTLIFLYLIIFSFFTKLTGILTLIFGVIAVFYLYLKNEKFKNKKKSYKIIYSVGLSLLVLFFGVGGITYNPNLASSKLEQSNAKNDDIAKKNEDIVVNNTEENVQVKDDKKEISINNVNNIEAEIHFINTGNSDSIVIKQGDKSILIDAGDNDDESLIVNYLKDLGISKLNYVISTHPDADHCGGLDAVFNNFEVEKLLVGNGSSDSKTYSDFINSVANKGISPSVPLEGSEHKLTDNSSIKMFNVKGIEGDSNESSLVTLFINGNDKILLMGDAGEKTESKLINSFSDVDLLKIGHHGSSSSTTSQFLDKVNPKNAVILVGKDNKYGHPSTEVMSRLEAKGIKVHRTDECGNIIYKSTGQGVSTACNEKGTYASGNKTETPSQSGGSKTKKSTAIIPTTPNTSNSSNDTSSNTQSSGGSVTTNEPAANDRTVYWTPNGKSYHFNRNCSTLSRSKTILEGPGSQCPKTDPCNVCTK